MYPHLDTAPPQSRFRRPWSPEPFNPNPTSSNGNEHDNLYEQTSEFLVDALDLADYTLSLNPQAPQSRYPQFQPDEPYPPFPRPARPLASRTSLDTPSLASSGSLSYTTSTRSPLHRPFSLPLSPRSRTSLPIETSAFGRRPGPEYSHNASPPSAQAPDHEIDIAQFPVWSRNWYGPNHPQAPLSPYDGPILSSPDDSATKSSPFDPGYSDPHLGSKPHHYPISDKSSRDLLPWGGEPPALGHPINANVKEERLRMLEQEFGDNCKESKAVTQGMGGEVPLVGSVNEKGRLVTEGPRKRATIRILQGLLALASGATSIYAAVIIKPTPAAPPAGKLPVYGLYVLSVITFLFMVYFFVFRPCCCSSRPHSSSNFTGGMGMPGMMVLPVQGGMGGVLGKKGRRGKKGMTNNDVQVNLIVDPGMFQGPQQDDEFDENASIPGSYSPYGGPPQNGPQRRNRPRRSVFAGLAMEEQWRAARRTLKIAMFFDVLCLVLWGAEFVLILMGKRCPSGSFAGWCNAYNVASAGTCLLCVASAISVMFGVKDLHASKASPRTRP